MSELLDRVNKLKELARTQGAQGQLREAEKTFEKGIALLKESIDTVDPDLQHGAAAELADLYGMLGGTVKREGDLVRAACAYDAGFRYELDPRYGIHNSYNAVNRLLTRVLLCPQSLAQPDALRAEPTVEFVNVPLALTDLRARLEGQIDVARSNDYWAAGDLALVCALIGDDECAAKAVTQFASWSPPPHARKANLKSVEALADLNTPRRQSLERLKAALLA